MQEENQNIQVFVRSRPLHADEKRSSVELITEKKTIRVASQNKTYSFDNVFDAKVKQYDVYLSVVEPLVQQVIEGYNCTVFAYGQTGTGKTYTMVGDRSDRDVSWDEDPTSGVIPRAIDQLIEELQAQDAEYTVRVSFLELYNEDAYDLLSPLSDTNKLKIYNDSERKGSVIIQNLVEMIVKTKSEIFEILEKGTLKRQTAPTLMNACSSRSHSIFSVTAHIKETTFDGEEVVKTGKLNLVDLAGSENIGRSGAVDERAREASNINKSLLTLGRVITSLVEKSTHIPYRDSKLTRLLQDSLGGKTKTSIIATISPGYDDLEDTISTLDYAQRAKKITNKPEVNLKMTKKTLINDYLSEINRLQRDLEAARDKKGVYVDAKNYASMETQIKEQEQSIEIKEARIEYLQQEMEKVNNLLKNTAVCLEEKEQHLEATKEQLNQVSTKLESTTQDLVQTKEKVEEQKVIVSCHQNTEKKLITKAKAVVDVAKNCVQDNTQLFNKLDSYKSIEDHNTNLMNSLLVSLKKLTFFNLYHFAFQEHCQKHNEEILNFSDSIKSTLAQGEEKMQRMCKENKSFNSAEENVLKQGYLQIQSRVDSFASEVLDLVAQDSVQTGLLTSNVVSIVDSFKSELANLLGKTVEGLIQKSESTMHVLNSIQSHSVSYCTKMEEMHLSQLATIQSSYKDTASNVRSIKDDLNEHHKSKSKSTNKFGKLKFIVFSC